MIAKSDPTVTDVAMMILVDLPEMKIRIPWWGQNC